MNVELSGGQAIVRLDWIEVYHAASAGVRRRIEGIKKGRTDYYCDGNPWGREVVACCGEMAVAALKDKYWHAIRSETDGIPGDAGFYEVRSTTRSAGNLIIRPAQADHPRDRDDPDKRFYLCTVAVEGDPPTVIVRGSKLARDAQQERFWETVKLNKPAYLFPQAELDPVDTSR